MVVLSSVDVGKIGDRLFGRGARLAVAIWIAQRDDPKFWQGECAEGASALKFGGKVGAGDIRPDLDRLADLGMIREETGEPGGRRQYYQRLESPLWRVIEAAAACCSSSENGADRAYTPDGGG